MYVKYLFFILFVTTNTRSVHFHAHISLTDHWGVFFRALGVIFNTKSVLHLLQSHACTLHHLMCLPFSWSVLCFHRSTFLHSTELCFSYKTVVLTYKDNKK